MNNLTDVAIIAAVTQALKAFSDKHLGGFVTGYITVIVSVVVGAVLTGIRDQNVLTGVA